MPRLSTRQEQDPDAYQDGLHTLEAVLVNGRDPMAARRAYLRETHRRALEQERAREQAIRAAAMPDDAAATLAQHRVRQEQALAMRREGAT